MLYSRCLRVQPYYDHPQKYVFCLHLYVGKAALVCLSYYVPAGMYYKARPFFVSATLLEEKDEHKMSRKVISLSLPEELLDRIDEHYINTGYASLSEYIRELVRNDLRQNAEDPETGPGWRSRPLRQSVQRFPKPPNRW